MMYCVSSSWDFFFFFFKQKTAYEMRISDWSSDVCSSDLLSEAREMLLEARRKLAKRVDPAEQAKLDKIAKSLAATNTFETIAEEWLEKIEKEGAAPLTLKKARWLLGKTYAAIGRRPIRSEEHTSELQSLMRISYAVCCLK